MAGAGYKLFNTGDVLTAAQVNTYLMEQTVMVFANAAARTTALSGVVSEGMISYLKDTNAVEVYDGSNWVSSDDPNAIQNTIVDAKGDLITATASDVPARLAVGNNGETLVADSSTSTGLRYTAGNAIGNPVLNSSFQIWQRGTTFTPNASSYAADRWGVYTGVTGRTLTRQLTGDTTNLPNIQYCLRFARDSGNTNTSVNYLFQPFETINTIPFAGKTVTMSFYARSGANFSGSILARLFTGTGTDQNPLVSYTGYASVISETPTLTTTWQRFSYTATVGATANEMTVEFDWTPSGTAGANDYYEVTGVQIDVGSVALPFRTYSATLAGELAACQRYYQKSYNTDVAVPTNATLVGIVQAVSPNALNGWTYANVVLKTEMRVAPTVTPYSYTTSQTNRASDMSGTDLAASSAIITGAGTRSFGVYNNSGGTITAAFGGFLFHYQASAEL